MFSNYGQTWPNRVYIHKHKHIISYLLRIWITSFKNTFLIFKRNSAFLVIVMNLYLSIGGFGRSGKEIANILVNIEEYFNI